MTAIQSPLARFLKKLSDITDKTDDQRYLRYGIGDQYERCLFDFSNKEIRQIVSDRYWNRYPSYICWGNRNNHPKPYGQAINGIVRTACMYSLEVRDILTKYSEGLFHVYTIDYTFGKDRGTACNRAYKSKDVRVRKRAAKHVSIRNAKRFIEDKDCSVRETVVRRLGSDYCYKFFINDSDWWTRSEAIKSSDLSSSEALKLFKEEVREPGQCSYGLSAVKQALLTKLNNEDILFALGETANDAAVSDYIKKRIEYHNLKREFCS